MFALEGHDPYNQRMYRHKVQHAFSRWQLTADGEAFQTRTSLMQPVVFQGMPAMLKIAECEEERRGAAVMRWWKGVGAAQVLAHEGDALLLERIGGGTLAQIIVGGREAAANPVLDDRASRVLCQVAARLHAPRGKCRLCAPKRSLKPKGCWRGLLPGPDCLPSGIWKTAEQRIPHWRWQTWLFTPTTGEVCNGGGNNGRPVLKLALVSQAFYAVGEVVSFVTVKP